MKRIVLTMYCFCLLFSISSKEDLSSDIKKKKENLIKFRGSVSFSFGYFFSYNPETVANHIGLIDYNYKYDYTNNSDPGYEHHKKGDPGIVYTPNFLNIQPILDIHYGCIIPFIRNKNFLLKNNAIRFIATFSITPVSLKTSLSMSIMPIAFLELSSGTSIGTGWNISSIGVHGMARNNYDGKITNEEQEILTKDSFYGIIMHNWFNLRLIFDFSYIMPQLYKRWTHIQLVACIGATRQSLLNYDYYDRPYVWELETYNLNGWILNSYYVIGYKIPVIEDKRKDVGEEKQFLGYVRHNTFSISLLFYSEISMFLTHLNDSRMVDRGWGSDFVYCQFGPNINFDLPNNFFITLGIHWKNAKIFSNDTKGNADYTNRYYIDWCIKLNRIICVFKWNF